MNTKSLAVTIAFAALSIVLNPIRIPTLYWPGFFYRLWEIPIVVVFLLFGARIGFLVAGINTLAQIVLFPIPAGVVAYPWGLVATLTMLLGVYLAYKLLTNNTSKSASLFGVKPVLYFTSSAIVLRAGIMPFVDYAVYHSLLPMALGRNFSEAYVIGLIPAIIAFNIIVALYTVPVAYVVAKRISKSIPLDSSFKSYI